MRRQVLAEPRREQPWRVTRRSSSKWLHDCDHAQPAKPAAKIFRADGAVLDPMTAAPAAGSLHCIAHRLDRTIADCVSRDLQPGAGRAIHQHLQLVRRCAPGSTRFFTHHHALGSAVDEDLDRPGTHHPAAVAGADAGGYRRLQQLPGEELVDAHPQAPRLGQLLKREEVAGKSAVHGGADRRDAARDQQALGQLDGQPAAFATGRGLDVGDHPHRRLEQDAVRSAVGIAADATAGRIRGGSGDPGDAERCRVGHPQMAASFIDEGGPAASRSVELEAMGRPALLELRGAKAHALLPLTPTQAVAVRSQARHDFGDCLATA